MHQSKRDIVAEMIALLRQHGWCSAGITDQWPVYHRPKRVVQAVRSDGTPVLHGGRQRFRKPGTNRRATVGPITTCFYRINGGRAVGLKAHNTERVVQRFSKTSAMVKPKSKSKELRNGRSQRQLTLF